MGGTPRVLAFGPIFLIGLCYAIAAPGSRDALSPNSRRVALPPLPSDAQLRERCAAAAENVQELLGDGWTVKISLPYVLGTDASVEDLDRWRRELILPTSRALQVDYFDTRPTDPITILIASSDAAYEDCVTKLGHRGRSEYAGIYSRDDRRLVLNLATGEGTLAHELTHALAHVDFPQMPEWFDEGLASLHEDSEFSEDGLQLIGLHNWRGELLRERHQQGKLPPLENFVTGEFNGPNAALHYAMARSLCLFLQERGRLSAFYRKARTNSDIDPTAGWSLAAVFGHDDLTSVEAEFHAWVEKSKRALVSGQ
jgi:hypothetical protein